MRLQLIGLLIGTALTGVATSAHADCSHEDYMAKRASVERLATRIGQTDPARGAALSHQAEEIDASNDGGIIELGHACGAYDTILMKQGR